MRADIFVQILAGISRNKACELIKGGAVFFNNLKILRPSQTLSYQNIGLLDSADFGKYVQENRDFLLKSLKITSPVYVSRSAQKLKYFLQDLNIDIYGNCLDIGSSTGGFVQILLEFGANRVVAVDVGNLQLHPSLKNDNRIVLLENTDIRNFNTDCLFDILTCDVSFISIYSIFDKIYTLFKDYAIILFKPQFEVGKDVRRNSRGVVVNKLAINRAIENFDNFLKLKNIEILTFKESKILGKDGNLEYFYLIKKV